MAEQVSEFEWDFPGFIFPYLPQPLSGFSPSGWASKLNGEIDVHTLVPRFLEFGYFGGLATAIL